MKSRFFFIVAIALLIKNFQIIIRCKALDKNAYLKQLYKMHWIKKMNLYTNAFISKHIYHIYTSYPPPYILNLRFTTSCLLIQTCLELTNSPLGALPVAHGMCSGQFHNINTHTHPDYPLCPQSTFLHQFLTLSTVICIIFTVVLLIKSSVGHVNVRKLMQDRFSVRIMLDKTNTHGRMNECCGNFNF